MATFLDRRALHRIFDAALTFRRRMNLPGLPAVVTVYLARAAKPARAGTGIAYSPLQALKTLHATGVDAFGGRIVRDLPDGLAAVFDLPEEALRAALHVLHAADLAGEFLKLPAGRIAISTGAAALGEDGFGGKAYARAQKLLARAGAGEAVIEPGTLELPLTGYHDIMADQARRGKIPGLGTVTTVTVKPLGLKRELDDELEEVDEELREGK